MGITPKAQRCLDLGRLKKEKDGAILMAALALLVFAFIAAVAIVTFVFSTRVTSATKEQHMKALEIAEAGLNRGILDMHTLNADMPTHITFDFTMSHSQAIAYLESQPAANYREVNGERYYLTDTDLIGYGKAGKYARAVKVSYDGYYNPGLDTPAPLYIDSPTITTTFDGAAFMVDGRDHDLNGNLIAGGVVKPAVVTTSATGEAGFEAGIQFYQRTKFRGSTASPSVETVIPPPVDIDAFSAQLDPIADYIYNGDTTFTGGERLGTEEHPLTIIVNGDLTIGGNVEGWGILDVRGDMTSLHGTMLWHGIMICHGNMAWLSGTPDVIGSLWIKSDPVDYRMSGTVKLTYSAQSIEAFGNPGFGYAFDTWEEL